MRWFGLADRWRVRVGRDRRWWLWWMLVIVVFVVVAAIVAGSG